MRANVPLILACIAVSAFSQGCSKSPRDRLQGKWRGVGVEHVAGEKARVSAEGWAKQTSLAFEGNAVTIAIPAEAPQSGTFKIAKIEGNKLTVDFKRSPQDSSPASSEIRFMNEDRLVWSLGGADVVMARQLD
ncbi:MAG: hypothetical protein U0414_37970 [Polyangiaceae bacterium]